MLWGQFISRWPLDPVDILFGCWLRVGNRAYGPSVGWASRVSGGCCLHLPIGKYRFPNLAARIPACYPNHSSNLLQNFFKLRLRYGSFGRGSAFAPYGPALQLRFPAPGSADYLMELRSTRKPRLKSRKSGEFLFRNAERQLREESPQPPPRYARSAPSSGPRGSSRSAEL